MSENYIKEVNNKEANPHFSSLRKPLLSVLHNEIPSRTPIWFMRQAGRYLPEYRDLRRNFPNFIEMCLNKDASVTAAIQPLERFDLDAAIVFSDIMILFYALGINVQFIEGIGPVMAPLGEQHTVSDLLGLFLSDNIMERVVEAIKLLRRVVDYRYPGVSVIGFSGAPWTLFCYLVEGKSSKNFSRALRFVYQDQNTAIKVLNFLADCIVQYLSRQIEAGVEVVKIFDSWAGVVPVRLSRLILLDPINRIVSSLQKRYPGFPVIVFPKGVGSEYNKYALPGVKALSIDGTIDFHSILPDFYRRCAIQGNIDNILLTCEQDREVMIKIMAHAYHLLRYIPKSRLIINTSHGLLPETKIENVELLISTIRAYGKPTA